MLIQLKQSEIMAALKQYIVQQGINLSNKDVKITFTAGRKESGISADVDIEDTDYIPGFSDNDVQHDPAKKTGEDHLKAANIYNACANTSPTALQQETGPAPEQLWNGSGNDSQVTASSADTTAIGKSAEAASLFDE